MELSLPLTIDVNDSCQDLYVAVNTYASTEEYAVMTERSENNNKGELQKVLMQFDKAEMFKAKGFGTRDTSTRKDEYLFVIIAIRDNKT